MFGVSRPHFYFDIIFWHGNPDKCMYKYENRKSIHVIWQILKCFLTIFLKVPKYPPVTIVETNLLHKREDDKFKHHPLECWKVSFDVTTPFWHQNKGDDNKWDVYKNLVEQNNTNSCPQLWQRKLKKTRLNLKKHFIVYIIG